MKLTTSTINALTKPGRYSDGRNLYLTVSKTGAKSWLFIYRALNGKQRELGLGSFTGHGAAFAVDLKAARLAADTVRLQLAAGLDPVEQKIAARVAANVSSVKFSDLLDEVLTILKREWKVRADGTYEQETKWRQSLDLHAKAILNKHVARITDEDVISLIKPVWEKTPNTGARVLYRIEKVMELAFHRKLHAGPNPARYSGHIEMIVGKRPPKKSATGGHKAMHYEAMPDFWQTLVAGKGNDTKALAFVILTAVRTDEARLARWDEVNFDKAVWTVPADRMKAGEAHDVPLSTQAIELLRSIPKVEGNPFIFTGTRTEVIGDTALSVRLGALVKAGEATVHGMRKTFRTWASKQNRWSEKACEHCLAHVFGSAVQRAYDQDDTIEVRAVIMQAWANYATSVQTNNVIQLAA